MATTQTTTTDFPALRPGIVAGPKPRPLPTTTGVRLDPTEEAARFMHRSPAEVDADWAAWDAYQAAMSRWIDGRGPRPE